ncbi:MAG: nucleoside hydrolase [Synechococcales bacterium]|nr:nucleoside hydrolase [Synechococcales bacterium]
MTQPILIDCDPGIDDAVALLLAFAAPELEILGITTVAGNVPLDLTQANARKICTLANRTDIPVYAGCPRPMLRSLITAEAVHGQTGLGEGLLPDPTVPLQPQHAVEALVQTLLNTPQPVTLATLGPLTNLALALIQAPQIATHIDEIVMMGGAVTHGNVTPSAEFNIAVDPHAAHVVFTSGIPITLLGLDATHQVLTTQERLAAMRAIATPITDKITTLLTQYGTLDQERYGLMGGPLHDPNVIAYLIQPSLYKGKPCHVEVELTSPISLGRTVVDWWNLSGRPTNATVIDAIDADGFYNLLLERLAQL